MEEMKILNIYPRYSSYFILFLPVSFIPTQYYISGLQPAVIRLVCLPQVFLSPDTSDSSWRLANGKQKVASIVQSTNNGAAIICFS